MAMTPHATDKKAAAWVHTAAPDDDYLPEPDRGSSDHEVPGGGDPEIPALAEWTASLNPEARRSNHGRAKRPTEKSKTVKLRDGRVGRIPTTLTIEEYNVAPAAAPVVVPVTDATPAPATSENRAPLPRRGGWNGPPIEVKSLDEWRDDERDRLADVAEMDRNYDEPDEYDDDGDYWDPAWNQIPGIRVAVTAERLVELMNWKLGLRDRGNMRRAAEDRKYKVEAFEEALWRKDHRSRAWETSRARPFDQPVDDAKLIADQWRNEAAARTGTCGNPNGCDGPIKAKGRCSPCHEWRRTHHGDERPAAKVNRVRRRKGN